MQSPFGRAVSWLTISRRLDSSWLPGIKISWLGITVSRLGVTVGCVGKLVAQLHIFASDWRIFRLLLLRGTIVNRTYGIQKKTIYLTIFTNTIWSY